MGVTEGILVAAIVTVLGGLLPAGFSAGSNAPAWLPRGIHDPGRPSMRPPVARPGILVAEAIQVAPAESPRSPKEQNDPLPPNVMPRPKGPEVVTPRGTPEGMGNEVDLSKTPGDDDPSDGVDEPGRDPVPGLPRPAPGVNKP